MKRKIIYLLMSMLLYNISFSQSSLRNLIAGEKGVTNAFTFLKPEQQIKFEKENVSSVVGLDKNSVLVLMNEEKDQIGELHYRYYQTYLGYPVENSMYILHTKDGIITGLNGTMVMDFDSKLALNNTPAFDAKKAIALGIASVNAKRYMWESNTSEQAYKREMNNQSATYYPEAKLVWYDATGTIDPQNLRLAYKVNVYAEAPLSRDNIYVDAQTGNILGKASIINYTDAVGTANTAYSGTQTIHSDLFNGSYRLRDYTRGNGIITLNGSAGAEYTNASANWSLSIPNQYALDAHWGVASTYDFYKTNFNRNSVNNAGLALYSYVNESSTNANNNAYWDGSSMHYGNLTSNGRGTTAIDITGHELTHGVTSNTCKLDYNKEPGAINESLSDIMGKSVEFWAKPGNTSWVISNDMGWNIRNMSNPNQFNDPDTYNGTNYVATTNCTPTKANDYCGVHTNSGVGNYFFYLLVNGGSGTNDLGNNFNVSGIGLSKADQIVYRSQTVYLTSTSGYANWRVACVQAARDLYGSCSNEAWQTAKAWYAVGVGNDAPPLNQTITYSLPFNLFGTIYGAIAANSISSSSIVSAGSSPTYLTANEVTLTPGFTVNAGSNFTAYVTPCTSSISRTLGGSLANTSIPSVSKEANIKTGEMMKVSPNPFTNSFTLNLKLEQNSRISVRLYDMMGKQIATIINNQQKQKGAVQLQYINSKLASGTYLCVVEINGKKFTEKVVKME